MPRLNGQCQAEAIDYIFGIIQSAGVLSGAVGSCGSSWREPALQQGRLGTRVVFGEKQRTGPRAPAVVRQS